MSFKFSVGQAVEYTPIGEKKARLYKVTRQMPEEEQAADLKYRIKSEAEIYERNVLECHLIPSPDRTESKPTGCKAKEIGDRMAANSSRTGNGMSSAA